MLAKMMASSSVMTGGARPKARCSARPRKEPKKPTGGLGRCEGSLLLARMKCYCSIHMRVAQIITDHSIPQSNYPGKHNSETAAETDSLV